MNKKVKIPRIKDIVMRVGLNDEEGFFKKTELKNYLKTQFRKGKIISVYSSGAYSDCTLQKNNFILEELVVGGRKLGRCLTYKTFDKWFKKVVLEEYHSKIHELDEKDFIQINIY